MTARAADDAQGSGGLRPVLLVATASVAFSVNDLVFKLLSGTYPLHEMMLVRSGVALILIAVFISTQHAAWRLMRTDRPGLHLLRACLMITANSAQYAALAALPLADATAIYYSAPLLITVFSVFLLRDHVGPWRWLAVTVGLLGVVLIVRPGGSAYSAPALLAVLSATVYALSQILTRRLGRTDTALTMAFFSQLSFTLFATLIGFSFGGGSFGDTGSAAADFLLRAWSWPAPFDLFLLVILGVISAVGGLMMTMAYRDGPPSLVASFEYLALPMSVVWGAIFWASLPDRWSTIGIALILGAGIAVAYREARLGRKAYPKRNTLAGGAIMRDDFD
ncbi:MAG: DMT family transporter [Albidovulum sp.]|uniref:DMT family transporter n=1 Tax=Albidovulum sp. TaxID=1872424 RepID=UPI003C829456